jgi:hypothetical protein
LIFSILDRNTHQNDASISAINTGGEIVDSPLSLLSNSAESAENPLRATLLAEPFPGTVAQGVVLVIA